MAEPAFPQSGDFVRTVLGGPVMLVKGIATAAGKKPEAICQWFAADGSYQEARFVMGHLKPADPPT